MAGGSVPLMQFRLCPRSPCASASSSAPLPPRLCCSWTSQHPGHSTQGTAPRMMLAVPIAEEPATSLGAPSPVGSSVGARPPPGGVSERRVPWRGDARRQELNKSLKSPLTWAWAAVLGPSRGRVWLRAGPGAPAHGSGAGRDRDGPGGTGTEPAAAAGAARDGTGGTGMGPGRERGWGPGSGAGGWG